MGLHYHGPQIGFEGLHRILSMCMRTPGLMAHAGGPVVPARRERSIVSVGRTLEICVLEFRVEIFAEYSDRTRLQREGINRDEMKNVTSG